MLKRLLTLLTVIAIAGLSMQALAAKDGEKGPGDRAYERASDNASFKRDRYDDDDGKKKHKKKNKAKDRDDDDDKDRDRDRDRDHDDDDKDRDKKKQRDRSGESGTDVKSDRKKSEKQQ
jgi:FtsZ-interacting cell division protein ZipA